MSLPQPAAVAQPTAAPALAARLAAQPAPYVADRARQTSVADGWAMTGWLGAATATAGLAHAVPVWLPLQLRDPDVVIAVATEAASAYPTLLLGLFLLVATFAARARWRPLAILGVSLTALAIVVLGSMLVYAATAVSAMHELAGGEPAVFASFRVNVARTLWFHGVTGSAAIVGGVVAVELARHYRMRQRV